MLRNRFSALIIYLAAVLLVPLVYASAAERTRPNVLLMIADDWGWPFAGAYGEKTVKTPNFDRLAREGTLFRNAFVSSPSCTPSRGALLTGQHFWRLEESANLWSTLQPRFLTYPEILAGEGYITGSSGKAWGPGDIRAAGRTNNPAGPPFRNFALFLKSRPAGKPFCFWLGSGDPHRPYDPGSGVRAGINAAAIRLPESWPDAPVIREDLADYFLEVQRFDELVGTVIAALEAAGELDNTLIAVTGDNGAPFPRGKTQLYDLGSRVPLAVRWGTRGAGRISDALVSLTDLAPTFLEAAGKKPPREMTGASMMKLLQARGKNDEGWRDYVVYGRERHTLAQGGDSLLACPMRAIRTARFLYIWNGFPERWPSGVPPVFRDCDDGPTKRFFVEHADDPGVKPLHELAFSRRPDVELYDLSKDPAQTNNIARVPERARDVRALERRLKRELQKTQDPRLKDEVSVEAPFDRYPYYGQTARQDNRAKKKQKAS